MKIYIKMVLNGKLKLSKIITQKLMERYLDLLLRGFQKNNAIF